MDKFYVIPWEQRTCLNQDNPDEVIACGFLIKFKDSTIKILYFEAEANYICKELNKALSKAIN